LNFHGSHHWLFQFKPPWGGITLRSFVWIWAGRYWGQSLVLTNFYEYLLNHKAQDVTFQSSYVKETGH